MADSTGWGGDSAVAELQGLDGAFSFAERLLQRIWGRGDFDRGRAATVAAERVVIHSPGRWNRLGGPDFLGARLEIGGRAVVGDIEIHLRAADWHAHHHIDDPKYRDVVLHVVLFPPAVADTPRADGTRIPILTMLPLLYRSLEEYAEDDAVERLASHPLTRAREILAGLPPDQVRCEINAACEQRWQQKVAYAAARIKRLGWSEACHQSALEVLGYRFNRGPMLTLAGEYPLEWWAIADRGDAVDALHEAYRPRWSTQPGRPANRPLMRVRQYAAWSAARPDWPERLAMFGAWVQSSANNVRTAKNASQARRDGRFTEIAQALSAEVCGDAVGGTRFHNLVCDAFWPLLAARWAEQINSADHGEPAFRGLWTHWWCGDLPANLLQLGALVGIIGGPNWPACHGIAQGLLAWVWKHEAREEQTGAYWCGRGT
jgi:hypothetical protein